LTDGKSYITMNFETNLQTEIDITLLASDDVKFHENCKSKTVASMTFSPQIKIVKLPNIVLDFTKKQDISSIAIPQAGTKYRIIRIGVKDHAAKPNKIQFTIRT